MKSLDFDFGWNIIILSINIYEDCNDHFGDVL